MFSVRRPPDSQLQRWLAEARGQEPTYPEVGATRGDLPPGYRHDRYAVHLGHGDAVFRAGVAALDSWAAQRAVGAAVLPGEPPRQGDTVLQVFHRLGLWAVAACRVVYRVDTPTLTGFAYGSLDRHPVSGEEAFLIERDAAGTVRARILVFSRPHHPLVLVGRPVARIVQRRTTRGYLRGIRAAIG